MSMWYVCESCRVKNNCELGLFVLDWISYVGSRPVFCFECSRFRLIIFFLRLCLGFTFISLLSRRSLFLVLSFTHGHSLFLTGVPLSKTSVTVIVLFSFLLLNRLSFLVASKQRFILSLHCYYYCYCCYYDKPKQKLGRLLVFLLWPGLFITHTHTLKVYITLVQISCNTTDIFKKNI